MFAASEEAFDQIAVPIEMAIEAALGQTIGAGRNHGLRARGLDLCNEVIGVVSLVLTAAGRRADQAAKAVRDPVAQCYMLRRYCPPTS
jgi:hypothetical protein